MDDSSRVRRQDMLVGEKEATQLNGVQNILTNGISAVEIAFPVNGHDDARFDVQLADNFDEIVDRGSQDIQQEHQGLGHC